MVQDFLPSSLWRGEKRGTRQEFDKLASGETMVMENLPLLSSSVSRR